MTELSDVGSMKMSQNVFDDFVQSISNDSTTKEDGGNIRLQKRSSLNLQDDHARDAAEKRPKMLNPDQYHPTPSTSTSTQQYDNNSSNAAAANQIMSDQNLNDGGGAEESAAVQTNGRAKAKKDGNDRSGVQKSLARMTTSRTTSMMIARRQHSSHGQNNLSHGPLLAKDMPNPSDKAMIQTDLLANQSDRDKLSRIWGRVLNESDWDPRWVDLAEGDEWDANETTEKVKKRDKPLTFAEAVHRQRLDVVCWMITRCDNDMVQRVDVKAPLNCDDDNSGSDYPIHIAVQHNAFLLAYVLCLVRGCVSLSASSGSNVNAVNKETFTPLVIACKKGFAGMVKLLLHFNADPTVKCTFQETDNASLMHILSVGGHLEPNGNHLGAAHQLLQLKRGESKYADVLRRRGLLNPNVQDGGGWTPLAWALEYGQEGMGMLLLDYGADPVIRDLEGNTCLHWAAYSGCVEVAKRLLKMMGSDGLSACNRYSDTPLHVASRQKQSAVIEMLLVHGADVSLKNFNGDTALMLMKESGVGADVLLQASLVQANPSSSTNLLTKLRVIDSDISRGREKLVVEVVNEHDTERLPDFFKYSNSVVETTSNVDINRKINEMQRCDCQDDCSSGNCSCVQMSDLGGKACAYTQNSLLLPEADVTMADSVWECNQACECALTCRNRVAQHGMSHNLQICKTPDRGWALRAIEDIPQGAYICEYAGEFLSAAEADNRDDDSYLFDLEMDGECHVIDAKFFGNVSRFINHSCGPNLFPVRVLWDHQDQRFSHICFYAKRNIRKNDELTFDYGDQFWIIKGRKFLCKCHSVDCKYDTREKFRKFAAEFKRNNEEEEEDSELTNSSSNADDED